MPRTTAALVQAVLQDDYGPNAAGNNPDLRPFINAANVIVNRVVACALERGIALTDTGLETDEATQMETWLAAHHYAQSDKPLASKSTNGTSASFQGQTGKGYESTLYGQMALRLDYSGCLEAIDKRKFARAVWLGKPVSQQIPYDQRD